LKNSGAAAVSKRAFIGCSAAWLCAGIFAAPPPELPGEDITTAVDAIAKLPDTTVLEPPPASPHSALWLESALKTWDAPSLSQQIDEDSKMIPVGKGAIFIPHFSDPALEPTVQINDPSGKLRAWGETGKKYAVEPGEYSIVLGSGSMNQRIVKKITVTEGRVIPVVPDWCGLSIDVVDESNLPFRGMYEIARVDEFEAYGRSYGRDMAIGERVKTWILKPGLYKIFSAGGSYNTLTNFITVRLIPGELVRVIIIENQKDLKIIGGGVVNPSAVSSHRLSHWSHNLNIGGTIMFNAAKDRVKPENTANLTDVAFLTLFDLVFKKGSVDWETNVFWKEGLNFSDLFLSDITFTGDDFRITSLYVWRVILPWLGPYFRTEFRTHFFPVYTRFEKNAPNHYFIVLNPDTTLQEIDSKHTTKEVQPTFSPLTADVGVGTNIDMFNRENYDVKVRLGIGYSQKNLWSQKYDWNQKYQKDTSIDIFRKIDTDSLQSALTGNYKILYQSKELRTLSYGPEFGLALNIRAGGWGVARGDLRTRIPLDPLISRHIVTPDVDVTTTVSWTLTRSITLDYWFLYTLTQPLKDEARVDESSHSIFLRFSLSSR
jgi:hypothetical protein